MKRNWQCSPPVAATSTEFVMSSKTDILEKYGYRELHPGTLLWTNKDGPQWDLPDHEVFFYPTPEGSLGGRYKHQVVLLKALTVITPYEEAAYPKGRLFIRLNDLCEDLGVDSIPCNKNDVDFKKDQKLRYPLFTALMHLGIDGYYHQVEKVCFDMEVCLFKASTSVVKTCLVNYK